MGRGRTSSTARRAGLRSGQGLQHEIDALVLQACREVLPVIELQGDAEMRHWHEVVPHPAVFATANGSPRCSEISCRRNRNRPGGRATAFLASEDVAVERRVSSRSRTL